MGLIKDEIDKYRQQVATYDAGRPTTPSAEKLGNRVVPDRGPQFDASYDAKKLSQAQGRGPMPFKGFDASQDAKANAAARMPIGDNRSPIMGGTDLDKMQQNFMRFAANNQNAASIEQKAQADSRAAQPNYYLGDERSRLEQALRSNTVRKPISAPAVGASTSSPQGDAGDKADPAKNAFAGNYAADDATGQGIYTDPETKRTSIRLTGDAGDKFMQDQDKLIADGKGKAATAEDMAARRKAMGEYGGIFKQRDAIPATARPGMTLSAAPVEYKRTVGSETEKKYGKRPDGTNKGTGYFGELKMRDGSESVATEMSIGVNIDGKEVQIPSMVPTLDKSELNHLLSGGKPTPEIIAKAIAHSKERVAAGKSPYADEPGTSWGATGLPAQEEFTPQVAPQRTPIPMTGNPLVDQRTAEDELARRQAEIVEIERNTPGLLQRPGSRDYIDPRLPEERQRELAVANAEQRKQDMRDARDNTIAQMQARDASLAYKGLPTDEARNLAMVPYEERRATINQRNANMAMAQTQETERATTADKVAEREAKEVQDVRKDATDRYVADKNAELAESNARVSAESKRLDREATLKAALLKMENTKDPILLEKLKGYNSWLEATMAMPGITITPEQLTEAQDRFGVKDLFAPSDPYAKVTIPAPK